MSSCWNNTNCCNCCCRKVEEPKCKCCCKCCFVQEYQNDYCSCNLQNYGCLDNYNNWNYCNNYMQY